MYSCFPRSLLHALSFRWMMKPPRVLSPPLVGWVEMVTRVGDDDIVYVCPSNQLSQDMSTARGNMLTAYFADWKVPPYSVFHAAEDITASVINMKPSFKHLRVIDFLRLGCQKGFIKSCTPASVDVLRSDSFDTITFKEKDILELI